MKNDANEIIEEEKKILAPLLGKLYISPSASEDKLRELSNEMNIAVDSKLVSDATGRNAIAKLATSLSKIVAAMGDRATPAAQTTRDSATPEVDADTPIESTEIHEEEESLAKETSELSIADSVDSADLREATFEGDDDDALENQLQMEVTRAMEDSVMDGDDSVMDDSREASVLSIRPKSKSASRQPTRMSARSNRAREMSESDSGEETL